MSFRIAPLLLLGSIFAVGGLVAPGCNRQPEGERCSLKNADLDCGTNLKCTPSSNLRYGSDGVDRCCPTSNFTDVRCTPGRSGGSGGSTGEGGAGGDGGAGGGNGSDGKPLGAECIYNSECVLPLVCKVGTCQYDCNVDRDCADGYRCSANVCVVE